MKKIQFLLAAACISYFACEAQPAQPSPGYIPYVTPIAPTAMPFLKYDEVPVSEYTGVPNIQIPIHTIKEGDFEFSLNLGYHAGGVRVSEEASWVGLGWNLDAGSVIQVVNDRDDLGSDQRMLPDYYNEGSSTFLFPPKYSLDAFATPSNNFSPSQGPLPDYGFVLYSDYYVPVNSSYNRSPTLFNASGYTNGDFVDSEPDVFKATFNNHSIQFIIDFKANTINVLNKKGYVVTQTTNSQGKNSWQITAPDGVKYFFDQIDEINVFNGCTTTAGVTSCNSQPGLSTRTWHLTKVLTPVQRQILFAYDVTSSIQNFPSVSDATEYVTPGPVSTITCNNGAITFNYVGLGFYGGNTQISSHSVNSFSPHTQSYLGTISFSNGSIQFKKSSERNDLVGDQQLDSIIIYNQTSAIKKFAFSYDYFVGSSDGGQWSCPGKSQGEILNRLKLTSVGQVGIPPYQFAYDATVLPGKTSFAVDYWGFYNGALSNSSLVPNPADVGQPSLSSNGNSRGANIAYATAATLNQIIYPTSGTTSFAYELNTFNHGVYNSISTGDGLRVKSVTSSTDQGVAKQVNYLYDQGQIINPINLYSQRNFNGCGASSQSDVSATAGAYYNFNVTRVSGDSFYTSSLFGSGNYVGYGKVTSQTTDQSGNTTGSHISYYSNASDIGAYDGTRSMILPARKDLSYPDNGLVLQEQFLDASNVLIQQKVNTYQYQMSNLYYGAKVSFGDFSFWYALVPGNSDCVQYVFEQDLVGYYPLYSGESLLQSSVISDYSGSNAVAVIHNYTYDNTNFLQSDSFVNSNGQTMNTSFVYPLSAQYLPNVSNLIASNILNHPVSTTITNNSNTEYFRQEAYAVFNGLTLVNGIYETTGSASSPELRMTVDLYDSQGNILQYHKPNDVVESVIWGYNNSLPIAQTTNALESQIAYTGFESNDSGGWTYSYSPGGPSGKTGNFGFSGGSLSKSSLPLGNYVISFWAYGNGGTGNVSGSVSASVSQGSWQLFSFTISSATSVSLTLSNVVIDDVRLFPQGAQMTTFNHIPMVGISSKTDANNQTTYYQYDSEQRLQNILDNQGNIVQNHKYGYKGQN